MKNFDKWDFALFIFLILLIVFFAVIGFQKIAEAKTTRSVNNYFFKYEVYPRLRFEECGKCKKICHNPSRKHDTGLLTCKGFSYRWHPKVVLHIINTAWGSPSQREFYVRGKYWDLYAKRYANCRPAIFALLLDAAVNEGHGTVIKRHQRINDLKADGKWGKESQKACLKIAYPAKAFVGDRIRRARKLGTAETNLRGWTIRSKRKLQEYGKDTAKEAIYYNNKLSDWLNDWCKNSPDNLKYCNI